MCGCKQIFCKPHPVLHQLFAALHKGVSAHLPIASADLLHRLQGFFHFVHHLDSHASLELPKLFTSYNVLFARSPMCWSRHMHDMRMMLSRSMKSAVLKQSGDTLLNVWHQTKAMQSTMPPEAAIPDGVQNHHFDCHMSTGHTSTE